MRLTVQRFTLSERIQHIILMVSLIVLVLTGLSLMFHDTALGRFMIALEGGLHQRGLLHRWAAIVLMALSLYHYLYTLLTEKGHTLLMAFLPRRGDAKKLLQAVRFNIGQKDEPPQWGKFTLFQKAQYLGVVIGVFVMIETGVILWFGPHAIALMPKWLVDLTLIVHGSEGLLIFLILLFWHLYNVHLAPGNFPMNMSWLTGRITVEELKNRYPEEYHRLQGKGEMNP